MSKKFISLVLKVGLMLIFVFSAAGCRSEITPDSLFKGKRVVIMYRRGLENAPFKVMRELQYLEKELPGADVIYVETDNEEDIIDALTENEVHVASVGMNRIVEGWSDNKNFRLLTGMCNTSPELITIDEEYKTPADVDSKDKIAINDEFGMDMLLLKTADERLRDPDERAKRLIFTAPEKGREYLTDEKSKVVAHMSILPYTADEMQAGGRLMVDFGDEVGAEFTYSAVAATQKFYNENALFTAVVYKCIAESIDSINAKSDKAMNIIADWSGKDVETVKGYLDGGNMTFTATPYGMMRIAELMYQCGDIKEMPTDYMQFSFPYVGATTGRKLE